MLKILKKQRRNQNEKIIIYLIFLQLSQSYSQNYEPRIIEQQIKLSKTSSGIIALRFLDAINSGDEEKMKDFIKNVRTEEYIKRKPVEKQMITYRKILEFNPSLHCS